MDVINCGLSHFESLDDAFSLQNVKPVDYSMALTPTRMVDELKEAAMCKAAHQLVLHLAQFDDRELACINILPRKLIRKFADISSEHIELIAKRLGRSFVLDRFDDFDHLSTQDHDLNIFFLRHYCAELFTHESLKVAKRSTQWFIDNHFFISLSAEKAAGQRLVLGIEDAIKQTEEAGVQLSAVKAGFTKEDLAGLFPRHKSSRFEQLSDYVGLARKKGAIEHVDPELQDAYDILKDTMLQNGYSELEAKLGAYSWLQNEWSVKQPIASFEMTSERGGLNFVKKSSERYRKYCESENIVLGSRSSFVAFSDFDRALNQYLAVRSG